MHVMALKICLYTVAFLGGMKSRKKKKKEINQFDYSKGKF